MNRLLLPLLTCSLLAACGGVPVPGTGSGGTGGAGGTGGGTGTTTSYSVSGDVLLPDAGVVLNSQEIGAQGLDSQQAQPDWSLPHVPGEVLIVGGANQAALGTLGLNSPDLNGFGVQPTGAQGLVEAQGLAEAQGLVRVQTPAGESDQAFAARLTEAQEAGPSGAGQIGAQGLQPGGVLVQPNYIYSALSVPNDPGYSFDSGSLGVVIGGTPYDQDYLPRIHALAGWDAVQKAGKPVVGAVTAVLDTGIDRSHPEFQGRLLPGYDFANNDSDPSEVLGGDVGHGTSSAGLIGATGNNGAGLAGLTWSGQNLLPVRVFDDSGGATTLNLSRAIDYAAAQKARVVNMSLGLKGIGSDPALARSLQAAANAGLVLVAAAGNTAGDGLYYPASDPNVLAVGALGKTDDLACYSARPKSGQKALDLVAPGGNATGSNCAPDSPFGILTLAPVSQGSSSAGPVQGGYTLRIGTSEAAPLVSGAASLMVGARPDLRAAQVKAALTGNAKAVPGGRLLDVGAALGAALALPQNSARSYALTVSAGSVSKSFTGTLAANSSSVPYSLSGLPAGQTTLNATLKVGSLTYSGTLGVNVTSNRSVQTIQSR